MAKHQTKTVRLTTRYSEPEYARLVEAAKRANCRNLSEYQRVAALTRRVSVVPVQDRRDLISVMVECAAAIEASPAGPIKDRAILRALEAFDRVTK